MCNRCNSGDKTVSKVWTFWEGHKIRKNLPLSIWHCSVASNFKWKIFSNFMPFSEGPNFTYVITNNSFVGLCPYVLFSVTQFVREQYVWNCDKIIIKVNFYKTTYLCFQNCTKFLYCSFFIFFVVPYSITDGGAAFGAKSPQSRYNLATL